MRWAKKGLVYAPDGHLPWAQHYAFPPTPIARDGGVLRLYVGFCDADTVGRIGWVDVRIDDPSEVVAVSREPVLDIGEPGCFDDNGVVPTAALPVADELYLYYVGYQLGTRVRYFQFEGLAISSDGGESFRRRARVPVTDRSDQELLNRSSAFVRREDDLFRMWYVGGDSWVDVAGKPLPRYELRYLESPDGVTWPDEGRICLDFADDDEHAFGRPWVFRRDGLYQMLYSVRTRSKGYRLGYAVSPDGVEWERRDGDVGIDVSETGWDSDSISYSSVVEHDDRMYLFYNGNDCGKTGFGYAELEEW
jgi:predicted GH43/DUF377 family glycosyl hydrolase